LTAQTVLKSVKEKEKLLQLQSNITIMLPVLLWHIGRVDSVTQRSVFINACHYLKKKTQLELAKRNGKNCTRKKNYEANWHRVLGHSQVSLGLEISSDVPRQEKRSCNLYTKILIK